MKYVSGWRKHPVLAAALGSLSVFGFSTAAYGQEAVEGPARGTIRVAGEADLQALAKITPEQARDAALAEVPGATFSEGELEEEDGYLVYEIELVADEKEVDVVVDAGNGAVLRVERGEDEKDGWFDW
jgi:hypothetical protein